MQSAGVTHAECRYYPCSPQALPLHSACITPATRPSAPNSLSDAPGILVLPAWHRRTEAPSFPWHPRWWGERPREPGPRVGLAREYARPTDGWGRGGSREDRQGARREEQAIAPPSRPSRPSRETWETMSSAQAGDGGAPLITPATGRRSGCAGGGPAFLSASCRWRSSPTRMSALLGRPVEAPGLPRTPRPVGRVP